MQSSPLQVSYRAIFTEMLLAQAAAVNTFAEIAGRCARVAREQQAAARKNPPKAAAAGSETQGVPPPRATDVARALAVLPRVSMILFLSHYDNLRRQHGVVRD